MFLLVQVIFLCAITTSSINVVTAQFDNSNGAIDDAIRNWECDYTYQGSGCSQEFQIDGRCFAYSDCPDCWDCDPCRNFDLDCNGCVNAAEGEGCYWCPGDAVCRSVPLGPEFWNLHVGHEISSCPTAQDWQQTCDAALDSDNAFSDPLYDAMKWSYEMINVEPLWQQGITGAGVHVRINDVGFDYQHPEFANNFDPANSCASYNSDPTGIHGTGVASILAAGGDNDECAVGIAPDVALSMCAFRQDIIEPELVELMMTQLEEVDISNNSWGPTACFNLNDVRRKRHLQETDNTQECIFDDTHPASPCSFCTSLTDASQPDVSIACTQAIEEYCTDQYENDPVACSEWLDIYVSCEYHALSEQAHQAFVQGVIEGRQGKGIIYVFAAGNAHNEGSFTNADGFVNTRFTIGVGSVDKSEKHASYSTPGAALFVVAPGGDHEYITNNIIAKPGGGCMEIIGGTSFSAPVVSGVIALILQVTPSLGWRDVQAILAETSRQVDPEEPSWTTNGAGLHHSYKYGFGIVDALAAVEASKNWTNIGPERQLILLSGPLDIMIEDDASRTTINTQTVSVPENFTVESVVVYMSLQHASRGDLEITLTSPSGTESILQPGMRPENQQLAVNETWKLMTVRNWGERASGDWTLAIVDESPGDRGDCANMPYEYLWEHPVYKTIEVYTCLTAEDRRHCAAGVVYNDNVNTLFIDRGRENLTAAEACCACGGGVAVSDVNVLRSWTLAIYGHESIESDSEEAMDGDFVSVGEITSAGIEMEATQAPTMDETFGDSDQDQPGVGDASNLTAASKGASLPNNDNPLDSDSSKEGTEGLTKPSTSSESESSVREEGGDLVAGVSGTSAPGLYLCNILAVCLGLGLTLLSC
ncbi:Furin-like protease 1, isoform 1 [Seminavis robusta]|uniref:subtilisin n=1 Tax=Seminavis robusta TaxID=568900 RepID=A0A9N8D8P7_9STRA|nr:Furin-like protease 1, isoform 1 [Seminavis robusta]|eukprot:Sro3_g002490.1 Furin-like protease 1, isoform 1 (875) ;mRNA; r:174838-177966